jgi:hypothetical protein
LPTPYSLQLPAEETHRTKEAETRIVGEASRRQIIFFFSWFFKSKIAQAKSVYFFQFVQGISHLYKRLLLFYRGLFFLWQTK